MSDNARELAHAANQIVGDWPSAETHVIAGGPVIQTDGGKRIETHQEAVECGQQSGKTERQHVTCPKCGEDWQNLPKHLPYCDGELQTDGGRPEPAVATSARVAADIDATLEPVGVALEVAEDLAETERARELIREAHQIEICQRGED